jgi:hypothetical protein
MLDENPMSERAVILAAVAELAAGGPDGPAWHELQVDLERVRAIDEGLARAIEDHASEHGDEQRGHGARFGFALAHTASPAALDRRDWRARADAYLADADGPGGDAGAG